MHISKRTVRAGTGVDFPRALKKYDIAFVQDRNRSLGGGEQRKPGTSESGAGSRGHPGCVGPGGTSEAAYPGDIKDKKLKKLYYYSNLFGVSEATVSSDLEAARGWLHRYGLEIIRKPGYGVLIEGNEAGFRKALKMFIDENINSDIIQEI